MRALRAFAAVLIGLVMAEAGLHLVGWIYLAQAGRGSRAAADGAATIVCLGDSHVFGLYEEAEDAFPARLQAVLDASADGSWRVVNGGRPGEASMQVADHVEAALARYDPSAVVVTIGVNDAWRFTTVAGEAPWYEGLGIVKLLRIVSARGRESEERTGVDRAAGVRDANEEKTRGEVLDDEQYRATLTGNLRRVHAAVESHGARLVLATYATDERGCGRANAVMRELARTDGITLADAVADVAPLVDELSFERTFHMDLHPRPPTYAVLATRLYQTLREAGVVAGDAAKPADAAALADSGVTIEVLGSISDRDSFALAIEGGTPHAPFRLMLFGLREEGEPAPTDVRTLRADPLLRTTMARRDLSGEFDGAGRATISLAPLLSMQEPAALAGRVMQAGYLQHAPGDDVVITHVPPSVTVPLR